MAGGGGIKNQIQDQNQIYEMYQLYNNHGI